MNPLTKCLYMFICIPELMKIVSKWDSIIPFLGLQKQLRRHFFFLRFNSTKKLSVGNFLIESPFDGILRTKLIMCPPYSLRSYIHQEKTKYQEKSHIFFILVSLFFPMINLESRLNFT